MRSKQKIGKTRLSDVCLLVSFRYLFQCAQFYTQTWTFLNWQISINYKLEQCKQKSENEHI